MAGTNFFKAITSVTDACLVDSTVTSVNSGLLYFAKCTGSPETTANLYGHGCIMIQTDSGTGVAAVYQNTGSVASPSWTLFDTSVGTTATSLVDGNAVTAVAVSTVASQVNHLLVTPSATGAVSANAVTIVPEGSDSNVSIALQPKGLTGLTTIGTTIGTGTITVGSSAGAQGVNIAHGSGATSVNIANTTTAGAQVNIASSNTGAVNRVDIVNGNTTFAGGGVVNIAAGTPTGSGTNLVTIGSNANTGNTTTIQAGNGPLAMQFNPATTGGIAMGATAGTGDISVGRSSASQIVHLNAGTNAPVVNVANAASNGATVTIAGQPTANAAADVISIGAGNAVGSGTKTVSILTGAPATEGNNRLVLGGGEGTNISLNARTTLSQAPNIVDGAGSNNAITGDLDDALGVAIVASPGLRVSVLLANSLQAGANTFALSGGAAVAIKSHYNPATDIATAYVSGGLIEMIYDGSVWQDLSQ